MPDRKPGRKAKGDGGGSTAALHQNKIASDRFVLPRTATGGRSVNPALLLGAYLFFAAPLVSADQLPPTSGAAPGAGHASLDMPAAGALEARGPSPFGIGRSRGITRGSSGVIWKISRKMPGVSRASGLIST